MQGADWTGDALSFEVSLLQQHLVPTDSPPAHSFAGESRSPWVGAAGNRDCLLACEMPKEDADMEGKFVQHDSASAAFQTPTEKQWRVLGNASAMPSAGATGGDYLGCAPPSWLAE